MQTWYILNPSLIFYPLSDVGVSIPDVSIQLTDKFASGLIEPLGIVLIIYALLIFMGAIIHDTLHHKKTNKKTSTWDALKYAIKDFL